MNVNAVDETDAGNDEIRTNLGGTVGSRVRFGPTHVPSSSPRYWLESHFQRDTERRSGNLSQRPFALWYFEDWAFRKLGDETRRMARTKQRTENATRTQDLTEEQFDLQLSEAQRRTILTYASLPAHLAMALSPKGAEKSLAPFTLDELDELLDWIELAIYRAKGNERQKVRRIVEKVAGLLGSEIKPARVSTHQTSEKTATVFQIKMTLMGVDPPIWRRVHIPDCTLEELHEIIQVTMGWEFEHLYRFTVGGVDYTDLERTSDKEAEDAFSSRLSAVLPTENRRPRFSYEYDFGDRWIHQLIVEERFLPKEELKYPSCVGGQFACPPEDCGGPWAYSDFVDAIGNPGHRRHEELLEWVGGNFDPKRFDQDIVNNKLQHLWTRRA